MKKIIILLCISASLMQITKVKSQPNLVPNYSFEDYFQLNANSLILQDFIYYWSFGFGYYHVNRTGDFSIPANITGHQYPRTGNAYCGLYTYAKSSYPIRQYIRTKLLQKLQNSKKYTRLILYASDNNIKLKNAPTYTCISTTQYAIKSSQNAYPNITKNTILGSGYIYPNMFGIQTASNSANTTVCNSVTNLGRGFDFFGGSKDNWSNNTMTNCKNGMRLNTSSSIGPQTASETPSDNQWFATGVFTWSGTGTNSGNGTFVNANNTGSVLYVRTTPASYLPPNNSSILQGTFPAYVQPTTIVPATSDMPLDCNDVLIPLASQQVVPNNIDESGYIMVVEEMINTEYVAATPVITNEVNFNNQDDAYRKIEANPDLATLSTEIDEFYIANQTENVGKFTDVENLLKDQQRAAAQALLQSIATNLSSEENYKIYYTLYDKFMNGELTAADTVAIDTLAYQCPELGGAAVYKLENLRALVFNAYNATVYHCEIADPVSAMRVANAPTAIKIHDEINEGKVIIAPNPSNGNFNIQATYLQNSSAQCEIYSVDGKKLFDESIQFNGGVANLNTKLIAGIYSIKIIERKQTTTHKILIK